MVAPALVSTGLSSFVVTTFAVQPGTGWYETELKGWSAGRSTTTLVVDAVADSVGTRNVRTA